MLDKIELRPHEGLCQAPPMQLLLAQGACVGDHGDPHAQHAQQAQHTPPFLAFGSADSSTPSPGATNTTNQLAHLYLWADAPKSRAEAVLNVTHGRLRHYSMTATLTARPAKARPRDPPPSSLR